MQGQPPGTVHEQTKQLNSTLLAITIANLFSVFAKMSRSVWNILDVLYLAGSIKLFLVIQITLIFEIKYWDKTLDIMLGTSRYRMG
jgi:hypothetical protein